MCTFILVRFCNVISKDHVTPKTGGMVLKFQLCHHRNKLLFKIFDYVDFVIISLLYVFIK